MERGLFFLEEYLEEIMVMEELRTATAGSYLVQMEEPFVETEQEWQQQATGNLVETIREMCLCFKLSFYCWT